jgi:aarF domain-containing kinase
MKEAHLEAVLALGRPFVEDQYDFSQAKQVTSTVRDLIPTMLEHRLTPPPDETYSLHRKVSGIFLLCSRLEAKVECKKLLEDGITAMRLKSTRE